MVAVAVAVVEIASVGATACGGSCGPDTAAWDVSAVVPNISVRKFETGIKFYNNYYCCKHLKPEQTKTL